MHEAVQAKIAKMFVQKQNNRPKLTPRTPEQHAQLCKLTLRICGAPKKFYRIWRVDAVFSMFDDIVNERVPGFVPETYGCVYTQDNGMLSSQYGCTYEDAQPFVDAGWRFKNAEMDRQAERALLYYKFPDGLVLSLGDVVLGVNRSRYVGYVIDYLEMGYDSLSYKIIEPSKPSDDIVMIYGASIFPYDRDPLEVFVRMQNDPNLLSVEPVLISAPTRTPKPVLTTSTTPVLCRNTY